MNRCTFIYVTEEYKFVTDKNINNIQIAFCLLCCGPRASEKGHLIPTENMLQLYPIKYKYVISTKFSNRSIGQHSLEK